jgi:Kdo2-lipid IVA lauroyltransferase/acyltransferase
MLSWLLRAVRRFDLDRTADLGARLMRRLGPRLRGHRVARAQLAMAFPAKSEVEREQILADMWDNLGRVAGEYPHFDRLWDYDWATKTPGRITMDEASIGALTRLRAEGCGALMFAAHLANWEIPALAAPAIGREIALVFRAPRYAAFATALSKAREQEVAAVIPAGPDTQFRIREYLRRNWMVGLLIDQHSDRGIDVEFFGRTCKVNPMIARFARLFDCPIYGARAIRLEGSRFRFELNDPLTPPRDAEGKIDIAGTMQLITTTIEGWVREHPEQWLWIHRRWR